MKLKVKYRCDFECVVDVPDGVDLAEEIYSEIDIPEGGKNDSTYVPNSYEVLNAKPHDDEAK